ncbi:S8 family peptidase [Cohnella sp. REN36]|uniref:S8 family peptidase n=1 Tax=Cohnella sp. REN36 TaxID=2887347 RepID=UPI001D153E1B|nr:S8 family peptidase [Cohnella sp. REN36]MCC3374981.1 S8 family peptidase [Cohnella sp. REN36]
MDTSGFLKWLQGALAASGKNAGRTILRVAQPSDYFNLLSALRRARRSSKTLRAVRQLGIIRGFSFPLPIAGIPEAYRGAFVCEEDPIVTVRAPLRATRSVLASDLNIPWGVRRIRAPLAWNRTTGQRVKIGVIDTGVDFQHPDLRHALERGINLLQRTMLPHDDNGHGTHIAGSIAAANPIRGMIGVAPRSSIYPVKAFDHNGTAFVSDIILGIEWCVRNRIDIVNMSFGMRTRSKALLSAVNNAYRSGVLIVASSGNDGKRGEIDFPARFANTVSVGALNRQGRIAKFTNRSAMVDIYAPGEQIESAWLRGRRRIMSGTSMATSHVTGAIALLLAEKPELTPGEIKDILKASSRPLQRTTAPRGARELDVMRMLQIADDRQ